MRLVGTIITFLFKTLTVILFAVSKSLELLFGLLNQVFKTLLNEK